MRRTLLLVLLAAPALAQPAPSAYAFHDAHFHLTNYVQKGTELGEFVAIMGDKTGRATVFGIPLQQQWSYQNSGEFAPTYYLQTDAPLYYYSFTDAMIAMAYLSLPKAQQARLDPMITGFNPADMYATDHIRRVLELFPGVFSGIGEFTVHKEFVSSKIAGEVASLTNPALDRILAFAGEVGLVVILHSDLDVPFSNPSQPPVYAEQLRELFERHPKTTIIWAHLGVGRVVTPIKNHLALIEKFIAEPKLAQLHFDLSWSELAKYVTKSKETIQRTAEVINAHPERFLFGTDEVAPQSQQQYVRVFEQLAPLLSALNPQAREKFLKGNYERLFDQARRNVREWERQNVKAPARRQAKRAPASP